MAFERKIIFKVPQNEEVHQRLFLAKKGPMPCFLLFVAEVNNNIQYSFRHFVSAFLFSLLTCHEIYHRIAHANFVYCVLKLQISEGSLARLKLLALIWAGKF